MDNKRFGIRVDFYMGCDISIRINVQAKNFKERARAAVSNAVLADSAVHRPWHAGLGFCGNRVLAINKNISFFWSDLACPSACLLPNSNSAKKRNGRKIGRRRKGRLMIRLCCFKNGRVVTID